jgi:diguanylate cyclase (GGDEF)-like protein
MEMTVFHAILVATIVVLAILLVFAQTYILKRLRREKRVALKLERYLNELGALQGIIKAVSTHLRLDKLFDRTLKFAIHVINQAQTGAILLLDHERRKLLVRGIYGFDKDIRGSEHFLGEGYTGWVAREAKPLLVHDVQADYQSGRFLSRLTSVKADMGVKSSVAAPIMFEDKVLGVLILQSTKTTHAFTESDLQFLSVIADQVAIAIENNRLYQEAQAVLSEHLVLYEIGLVLTSTEDVGKILNLILESATRITGTAAGSIALYNRERREFYLASSMGFSPAFSEFPRWKLRPGGLTSQILHQEEPLIVPDITVEGITVNQRVLDEGIKSLVACPLELEDKVVGILYVDDHVPREFKEEEITALKLLANQATIALLKAQAFEQTMELAITDGLTKVFNHRYFQEQLQREIKRSKRYRHPLSLIMLDIDHFKKYNDYYGHPRGDSILKKMAHILKSTIRETDIVARYGGEEFSIILPETGKPEVKEVARKILEAIEKEEFCGEEVLPGGKFTVSCGIAVFPDDAVTRQDLIDRADQALYEAKQSGRNKVCAA